MHPRYTVARVHVSVVGLAACYTLLGSHAEGCDDSKPEFHPRTTHPATADDEVGYRDDGYDAVVAKPLGNRVVLTAVLIAHDVLACRQERAMLPWDQTVVAYVLLACSLLALPRPGSRSVVVRSLFVQTRAFPPLAVYRSM